MTLALATPVLLTRRGAVARGIRHSSRHTVNCGRILSLLRRAWALTAIGTGLAACSELPVVPDHLRIAGAEPERGRALIRSYGCGTCHHVDGVRGARGTVGPPLDRFAQRSVVAGILPNTPRVLVSWLMDPPALDPRTAMPSVGLDEAQARDIAAYLYTLGAAGAQVFPGEPALDLSRGSGPALETLRRSVGPASADTAGSANR
jgi:mono/diheme cytochrome c family protein